MYCQSWNDRNHDDTGPVIHLLVKYLSQRNNSVNVHEIIHSTCQAFATKRNVINVYESSN